MNYKLAHSWKILIPLEPSSPNYLIENKLFVRESGKSFLRTIGGGMEKFPLTPFVLRPTIVFYNALRKLANTWGFSGKKLPFTYKNNPLNIKVHYYFEKYIVLTVTYVENDIEYVDTLKQRTDLAYHSSIKELVLTIGGLILSGDNKHFSPLTDIASFSCTSVELQSQDAVSYTEKKLVEALTGHIDPISEIVDDVLSRNKCHQINSALTLIDKQGVIQQIPHNYIGKKEADKKFISCCNLFELFLVINQSIKDKLLTNNQVYSNAINTLVNYPENTVVSFTARRTIEQFVRDFHLSNALIQFEKNKEQHGNNVPIKKKTLLEGWSQFYASREFFAVLLAAGVAGFTTACLTFWAYLKTLS